MRRGTKKGKVSATVLSPSTLKCDSRGTATLKTPDFQGSDERDGDKISLSLYNYDKGRTQAPNQKISPSHSEQDISALDPDGGAEQPQASDEFIERLEALKDALPEAEDAAIVFTDSFGSCRGNA